MTPAKPAAFHPEDPPPGFEKKLVSFWQERRVIVPRLQLVHTNAASRQGNIQASYNWAQRNAEPGAIHGDPRGAKFYTIPTCQIDRDGRGALMLPSNRQSITNARANSFSLGFETADTGTIADPSISAFTDVQAEAVAVCCAYYAWGHGIPLSYPRTWDGSGTACHTEPFGYPLWTTANGKTCPGAKKKAQVRDVILPRAREILAAWLAPDLPPKPDPPPPTPPDLPPIEGDDDMVLLCWYNNGLWGSLNGGVTRKALTGPQGTELIAKGAFDALTFKRLADFNHASKLATVDELTKAVGPNP